MINVCLISDFIFCPSHGMIPIQAKEREAWSSKREAKIRSLEESNRSG